MYADDLPLSKSRAAFKSVPKLAAKMRSAFGKFVGVVGVLPASIHPPAHLPWTQLPKSIARAHAHTHTALTPGCANSTQDATHKPQRKTHSKRGHTTACGTETNYTHKHMHAHTFTHHATTPTTPTTPTSTPTEKASNKKSRQTERIVSNTRRGPESWDDPRRGRTPRP